MADAADSGNGATEDSTEFDRDCELAEFGVARAAAVSMHTSGPPGFADRGRAALAVHGATSTANTNAAIRRLATRSANRITTFP